MLTAMSSVSRVLLPLGMLVLQAGCHASGHTPAPVATRPPLIREGYVEAGGGVQLYYRLVGTGRDTVVVLHGGPGFNMEYIAKDLSPLATSHALLFYDQRGAGRSSLVTDSASLDGQRFAEDLEKRIERLIIVDGIPLQRKALVQAFQDLEARRDSSTRAQMQKWREARLASPGDAAACRAYYVLWFGPFFGDSSAASRSQGDFCAGSAEARRNKMASVDRFVAASLGEWDWRPAISRVDAPALVIHGSADVLPVESAREWAAALPNARLVLLEGVGHFPYLEAPEAFFPAVDAFLRDS